MIKTSHFIWTFTISLFIFYFIFKQSILETSILSFVTASLSSLPDIDIKFSKKLEEFNRNTYYIFFIITIPLSYFFKHRTWTHTIYIPAIIFYFSEYIYDGSLQIIFRILYLALFLHLFEDSLTVKGIKLFYPFNFRLRLAKFNTASNVHFHILNFIGVLIGIIFIFMIKFY